MYVGFSGATCVYACILTCRSRICGKICFFSSGKSKKGTSSMHREMERPSDKVAWGEEKLAITYAL
jgi:hypothetical protein